MLTSREVENPSLEQRADVVRRRRRASASMRRRRRSTAIGNSNRVGRTIVNAVHLKKANVRSGSVTRTATT